MNTKPILKISRLVMKNFFLQWEEDCWPISDFSIQLAEKLSERGSTSACLRCISHIVLMETVFFQVYWFAVNTVLQKYEPSYIFMWLENKD